MGACRFKDKCSYDHTRSNPEEEKKVLKEKVEILEKTVNELTNKTETKKLEQLEKVMHALTRKVLSLEHEIEVMKNRAETDKKLLKDNTLTKESSFNINDIKYSSSTPKTMKNKVEQETSKEELLNCKECNFKCSKKNHLKKHMVTNHQNHKCKECEEELSTFIELLKHVAKHHEKDKAVNYEEEIIKSQVEKDGQDKHTKKEEEVDKNKIFVFKGSKMNQF